MRSELAHALSILAAASVAVILLSLVPRSCGPAVASPFVRCDASSTQLGMHSMPSVDRTISCC